MSLRLILGVTTANYPYGDTSQTTGDVAQKLEDDYGLFHTFASMYEGNIAAALESSVAGALESALSGGPIATAPFDAGCEKIDTIFRQSIDARAYDGILPGVPTKAAQAGVRHSMKNPTVVKKGKKKGTKRPERASFFDTGLMSRNFKAWVEGKP
jgi:hypothetical protein